MKMESPDLAISKNVPFKNKNKIKYCNLAGIGLWLLLCEKYSEYISKEKMLFYSVSIHVKFNDTFFFFAKRIGICPTLENHHFLFSFFFRYFFIYNYLFARLGTFAHI